MNMFGQISIVFVCPSVSWSSPIDLIVYLLRLTSSQLSLKCLQHAHHNLPATDHMYITQHFQALLSLLLFIISK